MIHDEKSLHPAPRRSYRRFLIACVAMAIALSLLPAVTEAQQCGGVADCSCTPLSDRSFYPMGPDDGLGFATPQAECDYLKLIGFAPEEGVRAVGYLDIDYHHNGCVRGRRSPSQKSLAKGWRVWGTPDDLSVSGNPGAHAILAWSKKDADGKTQAVIDVYNGGIYRTSGMSFVDLSREIDHITFCRFDVGPPITVPTQDGQPDGPACCGIPYPKIPGERCTYRPDVLPGRQCRG